MQNTITIQVSENPMLEAILKAVFADEAFKEVSSRDKLYAISEAGKLANGFLLVDATGKRDVYVSFSQE